MPRPEYSNMLVNRRRQLGLSISQASQVLRLKEQVLIAFEEGDFDHIPKSGYAQGMLSSYARYLGLNPRVVVAQFSQDLNDYINDERMGSGEGLPYVESRGLLPTSGGPAGDLGAFATTSQPHSRQQSSPLVNTRRYVGSLHDGPARSYGYSEEDPTVRQEQMREARASGVAAGEGRSASSSSRRRRRRSGRSGSTARRSDEAMQTRGSGRSRNSSSGRSRNRGDQRSSGFGGFSGGLLTNPRVLIGIVGALVALIIIGGAIFAVRSCSTEPVTDDKQTVPVSQSETTSSNSQQTTGGETTNDAAAETADAATTSTSATTTTTSSSSKKTTTPQKTSVVVSVESGLVSWVEVLCDGESKIATTVTGPWSETYDVKDSITIEVGDTAAVTVTENGKKRQFDTKSSGIGSITIQGTPDPVPAEGQDAATGEQQLDEYGNPITDQTQQTTAQGQDVTVNPESTQETQETETTSSGEGEYLYTINGYDIYYDAAGGYEYFIDPESGARLNPSDGSPIG